MKGNAPDFRNVDVNSGKVVYKLVSVPLMGAEAPTPLPEDVHCTLLVQMIDEERIRIEAFRGDVQNPSFTRKALIYTR